MEITEVRFTDPEGNMVCVQGLENGQPVTMAALAMPGTRHWRMVEKWAEDPGNHILPYEPPAEPTRWRACRLASRTLSWWRSTRLHGLGPRRGSSSSIEVGDDGAVG